MAKGLLTILWLAGLSGALLVLGALTFWALEFTGDEFHGEDAPAYINILVVVVCLGAFLFFAVRAEDENAGR